MAQFNITVNGKKHQVDVDHRVSSCEKKVLREARINPWKEFSHYQLDKSEIFDIYRYGR